MDRIDEADTEQADLMRESKELADSPAFETEELTQVYVTRDVEVELARKVAEQLMRKDALGIHAREELGISEITMARPVPAAFTSAASFAVGATGPLALVVLSPAGLLLYVEAGGSLILLAILGMIGAKIGGAGLLSPTIRVTFWGALAMAITTGIGAFVGNVR